MSRYVAGFPDTRVGQLPVSTIVGTALQLPQLFKRKKDSACPYPEQYESHSFAKELRLEVQAMVRRGEIPFYPAESLIRKAYDVVMSSCLTEETAAGGRHVVTAAQKKDIMDRAFTAARQWIAAQILNPEMRTEPEAGPLPTPPGGGGGFKAAGMGGAALLLGLLLVGGKLLGRRQ
jgi:hypothetical protein